MRFVHRRGRASHFRRHSGLAIMAGIVAAAMLLQPKAYSADGFAVSAAYRTSVPESDDDAMKGRICRFTIKNSRLVRCDTIFYGMGQFPAISWDGTRVAFFRYGIYRSAKGNTLEGLQNPVTTRIAVGQSGIDTLYGTWNDAWVSVIEANGSIRNLVKLPVRPGGENGLDWPVGDWVYYACPNPAAGREGSTVRRVNTISGQDEQVASFGGNWMRRFTMTLDGTKLASEIMGVSNTLFNLPSLTHALDCPACNISVSPSGAMVGHYLGGRHLEVWFANDPSVRRPSLWDAANWNPDMCFTGADVDTVIGCEVIRWAVNSDKWFTQSMGWHGHAGNLSSGGNSVLINFIDHEALCASENPRSYSSGIRYGNCAGDFFVEDGPIGKWEDTAGAWKAMPNLPIRANVDTAKISADSAGGNPASQLVSLTFGQGAVAAALSATDDASWLTATVEGSGTGQGVRVSANIAGLSMGNYLGSVIVSGGTLRAQFFVSLRVNGTPRPAAVKLARDTLCVQTSGTVQCVAALRDQFNQSIAGTVVWSVDNGGTISNAGLFTSNGTAGTFKVIAASGGLSDTGWINATSLKPLPSTGNLKELLCLETAAGSPYLPQADASGIESNYTGASRKFPVDGQQVTVNGNVYTWKLRTDADGIWADDNSKEGVVAYWYTTIVTTRARPAQIICTHDDEFTAWQNGNLLTYRPWATSTFEDWGPQFTLGGGGNGMFMKLYEDYGGNWMSVRFIDPKSKEAPVNVQYFPPGEGPTIAGSHAAPRATAYARVRITERSIAIRIGEAAAWSVSIARANGAIVASRAGINRTEIALPADRFGKGVYVLKISAAGTCRTQRFVIR
jgi:hypothetical protein